MRKDIEQISDSFLLQDRKKNIANFVLLVLYESDL